MKFKYTGYSDTEGKSIYRPTIPIMFKYKSKFIFVRAIIDSGADYSILPIEIAGELGIKLDRRSKATFYGAGKNPFTVYKSPVQINHLIRQGGFRPLNWKSALYFAESQPSILLGNRGFLNKFKVILNGPKKEVEILKHK